MSEEHYSLRDNRGAIGELYPKIVDKYGNMIDGNSRGREFSEWRTETREQIDTPVKLWLARISANTLRRTVGRAERADQFRHLAEELTKEGVAKEEIIKTVVHLTTFSERYVRELLPDAYKQRPGAGGIRVELSSTQKPETAPVSQKTPLEVLSGFKQEDFMPEVSGGNREFIIHQLEKHCGLSPDEAEQAIRGFRKEQEAQKVRSGLREAEEMAKPVEPKRVERDTWQTRKARMSESISRMDERMLFKVQELGLRPESNKEVCVLRLFPDQWYEGNPPLAVFFDGSAVHSGREDRDEANRDLLRKRGVRVLSISYDSPTDQAVEDAARQIKEALVLTGSAA